MGRIFLCRMVIVGFWLATVPARADPCVKSYAEVFRQVAPSVVRIFSVAIDPFSLNQRVQLRTGSGVVIDDAGNVITSAHIVYEASKIMIADGESMEGAELIGIDPVSDLAVVRLRETAAKLPKAALGDSGAIEVGTQVLAIGYPLGVGKAATQGIVSGVERRMPFTPMSWLTPLIQTDAAVSPGNSGGPLVDLCGRVLGINTLAGKEGQNINFAVPIDLVRELLPQLLEHGRVVRAWHGIHGRLVPPPLMASLGISAGFLIETIEPGSPAEKIGLRGGDYPIVLGVQQYLLGGDVITEVNGEQLKDMETVVRIVRGLKVGDTLNLKYVRKGREMTATVTLPERPILPGDMRRFRGQADR